MSFTPKNNTIIYDIVSNSGYDILRQGDIEYIKQSFGNDYTQQNNNKEKSGVSINSVNTIITLIIFVLCMWIIWDFITI